MQAWRVEVDNAGLLSWIAANRYVPKLTQEQWVRYSIDPQ